MTRNRIAGLLAATVLLAAGVVTGATANKFKQPKSVLHVVTVQWKADSTPQQRDAAISGIAKMASQVPGITNVWVKTLKVQPDTYNNAFVMEFKDEAAFKAYADNAAHKEWEKVYLPIRERSTTHDITN